MNIANDLIREYDVGNDPEKLEGALALYKKALEYDPAFPDIYVGIANIGIRRFYAERGARSLNCATKAAQKAVELKPDMPHAHLALGRCYSYSGDLEKAISEMETAISLDPNFATAHHDIGILYLEAGKRDEAVRHLQTAASTSTISIVKASAQALLEELCDEGHS